MFKPIVFCTLVALLLPCFPIDAAHAKAHYYCKLWPINSAYHNFGEVATYGTQIGHANACQSTCNATVNSWLGTAANKNAACAASNNANLVSYSAVGTGSYIPGNSNACNGGTGGGHISFIGNNAFPRNLVVNGTSLSPPGPSTFSVQPSVPVNFELNDSLQWHAQKWTYTATLYRGSQVVESFSQKFPAFFKGCVQFHFSTQQASFVHGNLWKVVTSYATGGYSPILMSFTIP